MEQLRVHVRNLSMLALNNTDIRRGCVELYEKGYGKDAAAIAKEAITYGIDSKLNGDGLFNKLQPKKTSLMSF